MIAKQVSVLAFVSAAFSITGVSSATAQNWPTRPVTIVDPIGAGAVPDTLLRIMTPRLSELLGQPVIIENASGAGGMIGVSRVAKAAPDGYQLVIGTAGTHAYNQTLFKTPLYDAATDFAPVALFTEQPLVLITRRDLPANNLHEFIDYTKTNQTRMQYGSLAGTGSANHIICALFNASIGVTVSHVPYRPPSALAYQDLITGRIDYVCPLASGDAKLASRAIRSGESPFFQRTDREFCLTSRLLVDFEGKTWNAFFAPKRTPAAKIQKLHDAIVAAIDTPAVRARIEDYGAEPVAPERRSPEYLQEFVKAEIKRWAVQIKAAGAAGQ
jgi:tripartite-type tricarboxylate transporter receptor subunit TctC